MASDATHCLMVQDRSIRQRMNDTGISSRHISPAAFAERIRRDTARDDAISNRPGCALNSDWA
jgi:hypothetical protein